MKHWRVDPRAAVWGEVDGETVLLDLSDETYLGLNRAAASLWPALVEGSSEEALVARLMDQFALDETAARGDVLEFLDLCRRRSLLLEAPDAGQGRGSVTE